MEGLLLTAEAVGFMQARLQHVAALEMISNQRTGNIDAAREWRSIIRLPKFANSVEGALALQRLGGSPTQRTEVSRLLAKEYVVWQITRAREKADALIRLIHENRATAELIYARAAEIQGLSQLPGSLLQLATGSAGFDQLAKRKRLRLPSRGRPRELQSAVKFGRGMAAVSGGRLSQSAKSRGR